MTQERIFDLLIKKSGSKNTYDFPTLVPEGCDLIAKELSSIITETLKYKSSAQTNKRLNILKFLRNSYGTPNYHILIDEQNYDCIIKAIKPLYSDCDNDIKQVKDEAEKEIEEYSNESLSSKMINFYRSKYAKRKERNKLLDRIKKYDQEKISSSQHKFQVEKTYSSYETNENLITSLLSPFVCPDLSTNYISLDSDNYREKQIQFCYSLLNFGINTNNIDIFKGILKKLENYDELRTYEINFVKYLLMHADEELIETIDLFGLIMRSFMFIIEKELILLSVPMLEIYEEKEALIYLDSLKTNVFFSKVNKLSRKNPEFNLLIFNMIYTLYQYSLCNNNILLLHDF